MITDTQLAKARTVFEELQGRRKCPKFNELDSIEQEAVEIEACRLVGFEKRHLGRRFSGDLPAVESVLRAVAIKKRSIYIFGNVQAGKTSYLAAMVKEIIAARAATREVAQIPFLVARAVLLMTHYQIVETFHQDDPDIAPTMIYNAPYLLIDDLSAAHDDKQGYHVSRLEPIINYRWSRDLPTWVTSNISPETMSKMKGWERIYARFSGIDWMECVGIGDKDRLGIRKVKKGGSDES